MAGFQLTHYGRIWVTPKVSNLRNRLAFAFEGTLALAPTSIPQSAASRQPTEICEDGVLFLLLEP